MTSTQPTAVDPLTRIEQLAELLSRYVHRGADEYAIHASIARVLTHHHVPFSQEFRLSSHDVVDFLVDGQVALEVKVAGQRTAVMRQLQRYARHDHVEGVLLATTSYRLRGGLPTSLHGTPVRATLLNVGSIQ